MNMVPPPPFALQPYLVACLVLDVDDHVVVFNRIQWCVPHACSRIFILLWQHGQQHRRRALPAAFGNRDDYFRRLVSSQQPLLKPILK